VAVIYAAFTMLRSAFQRSPSHAASSVEPAAATSKAKLY
jgi:hypothetical protein